MIIGLTGQNAAGKGTIADYLAKKSFYYYSLSDVIREEAKALGVEINRDNLIKIGNELRENSGNHVLAERIIQKIEKSKHYVIDSIRNTAEVNLLKANGCILLNVEALPEKRFERIRQRNRENDPKTFEEFMALEDKENSNNKSGQQINLCQNLADHTIINNSTVEELYGNVGNLLIKISVRQERPSWDSYFMSIAKQVASRSNCMKRKVAAVVVKEKRIISTGYNGTPRGIKNCDEGGCKRCNSFAESGTKLDECLCSHAEENAIVQAAYHGISIKDAVLYLTFSPCLTCAKSIINSGIKEVIYNEKYPMADIVFKLFEEANIILRNFDLE